MAQQTITALFDRYEDASAAVGELEAGGVPHGDISIVGNNEGDRLTGLTRGAGAPTDGNAATSEDGAGAGASVGTVVGGAVGLLTGLGLIAIPGVGPVVAAGWLVATLTGAGIGAAAGGLVGGLTGAGVSERDAHAYGEGVRRGGTLVTVRADEVRARMAMDVLERHGSVDLDQKAAAWGRDGWTPPDNAGAANPVSTDARSVSMGDNRPRVRAYPGSEA